VRKLVKEHGQGYFWFDTPISYYAARRLFAPRYIQPAIKSPLDNYEYCIKKKKFFIYGDIMPLQLIYRQSLDKK
jgi:hypothetical protein